MPKTDGQFNLADYAPVADRLALFWRQHPQGRIVTELVSRTDAEVVFRALVYRAADEREPAATGWAAEREGDGDVNRVACLENTETSAIGRALANLGFTAARQRPSAEEMAKAARARARLARVAEPVLATSASAPPRREDDALQQRANLVLDLLRLISAAERAGVRPARAAGWRRRVETGGEPSARLAAWDRRLRGWLRRHQRGS